MEVRGSALPLSNFPDGKDGRYGNSFRECDRISGPVVLRSGVSFVRPTQTIAIAVSKLSA